MKENHGANEAMRILPPTSGDVMRVSPNLDQTMSEILTADSCVSQPSRDSSLSLASEVFDTDAVHQQQQQQQPPLSPYVPANDSFSYVRLDDILRIPSSSKDTQSTSTYVQLGDIITFNHQLFEAN